MRNGDTDQEWCQVAMRYPSEEVIRETLIKFGDLVEQLLSLAPRESLNGDGQVKLLVHSTRVTEQSIPAYSSLMSYQTFSLIDLSLTYSRESPETGANVTALLSLVPNAQERYQSKL